MSQLQRLVVDYRSGEFVKRVLYRSEDGPNRATKARTRIVTELARSGPRPVTLPQEGIGYELH